MPDQLNLGLKLFSTNTELIDKAKELWSRKVFSYIELYIIPASFQETIQSWKNCGIPFVIHAPHSFHGMNLARQEQAVSNRALFAEVQKFTDFLQGEIIIVHGGHTGIIDETIRQVRLFADQRIYLENKPKVGLHGEKCVGYSPAEFTIAAESGVFGGYVLDFGHAACAALSMKAETMELIEEFLRFGPEIFHISDGHNHLEKDSHLSLGKGSLDIAAFISLLPAKALLTLETPRRNRLVLDDFVKDVQFVWNFFSRSEA